LVAFPSPFASKSGDVEETVSVELAKNARGVAPVGIGGGVETVAGVAPGKELTQGQATGVAPAGLLDPEPLAEVVGVLVDEDVEDEEGEDVEEEADAEEEDNEETVEGTPDELPKRAVAALPTHCHWEAPPGATLNAAEETGRDTDEDEGLVLSVLSFDEICAEEAAGARAELVELSLWIADWVNALRELALATETAPAPIPGDAAGVMVAPPGTMSAAPAAARVARALATGRALRPASGATAMTVCDSGVAAACASAWESCGACDTQSPVESEACAPDDMPDLRRGDSHRGNRRRSGMRKPPRVAPELRILS
jgi:hypothetical protein